MRRGTPVITEKKSSCDPLSEGWLTRQHHYRVCFWLLRPARRLLLRRPAPAALHRRDHFDLLDLPSHRHYEASACGASRR